MKPFGMLVEFEFFFFLFQRNKNKTNKIKSMNDDVLYTYTQTRRYTKENKKKLDMLFFFSSILRFSNSFLLV